MLKYIVRRLLAAIPVLFGLSIILFAFVHLLPGDPCRAILGQHATPERVPRMRENLGLDQPLWQQYLRLRRRPAPGRLRHRASSTTSRSCTEFAHPVPGHDRAHRRRDDLRGRGRASPSGRFAARHAQGWIDGGVTVISLLGISIPVFVLGLTLRLHLRRRSSAWLPAQGRIDPRADLEHRDQLRARRLAPAWAGLTCSSTGSAPDPAGHRPGLDPARDHHPDHPGLRARREPTRTTSGRHGPRASRRGASTAATSCATPGCRSSRSSASRSAACSAGAVLTETVFAWPGVGRYVVDAISNRDYLVVQSSILIFALIFLVVNLIVDILYAFLNPRIRYS